jgi:hypothetical protein
MRCCGIVMHWLFTVPGVTRRPKGKTHRQGSMCLAVWPRTRAARSVSLLQRRDRLHPTPSIISCQLVNCSSRRWSMLHACYQSSSMLDIATLLCPLSKSREQSGYIWQPTSMLPVMLHYAVAASRCPAHEAALDHVITRCGVTALHT